MAGIVNGAMGGKDAIGTKPTGSLAWVSDFSTGMFQCSSWIENIVGCMKVLG